MAIAASHSIWSLTVFAASAAAFAASWGMFRALDRRYTLHRRHSLLADWACERRWRFRRNRPPALPKAVLSIAVNAKAIGGVENPDTRIIQIDTDAGDDATPTRWNLLARRVRGDWAPTGLRPSGADTSFVDLFVLPAQAALSNPERFTVVGADVPAARRLAACPARGLLPADIGLMLIGDELILDFSARPFDPIAFDRMVAIADQIAAHLPAKGK